jgi:hypothetical protein
MCREWYLCRVVRSIVRCVRRGEYGRRSLGDLLEWKGERENGKVTGVLRGIKS